MSILAIYASVRPKKSKVLCNVYDIPWLIKNEGTGINIYTFSHSASCKSSQWNHHIVILPLTSHFLKEVCEFQMTCMKISIISRHPSQHAANNPCMWSNSSRHWRMTMPQDQSGEAAGPWSAHHRTALYELWQSGLAQWYNMLCPSVKILCGSVMHCTRFAIHMWIEDCTRTPRQPLICIQV